MCNENINATEYILSNIKKRLPDLKVLLWTGRTWEDLMNDKIKTFGVLMYVNILIDGRYDRSKRDVTLPLRGSSNQRVIDVPNSIKENKIILYEIN
jgi:anaerobic ribonucleoside-triphosphate reductase activating protein